MNPPGGPYYYPSQQGHYPQHGIPPNYHNHPHSHAGYGGGSSHPPNAHPSYNQPVYSPPPSAPSAPDWNPNPFEVSLLDRWFREIDVTGLGVIQGAQAVGFLKKSNLHRDTLRKIWSLVDTQNRGYIDKRQFAVIMRLVALSFAHPHVPVSMERYYQTCHDDHYPLPPMTGTSDTSVPHQQPHHSQPPYSVSSHGTPPQTMQQPLPQHAHVVAPHTQPTSTPPLSHTDRILQSVPSTVELSVAQVEDDALSEFSDLSAFSISGTPSAQTNPVAPRPNTSQSLGDMDDMGDFQGPSVTVSAPYTDQNDDDFDDFQAALPSPAPQAPPVIPLSPNHSVSTNHSKHSHDRDSDSTKKKRSIEDMIALVAADPLNTHAPSLRQWQQEHHTAPAPEVIKEVDLLILDDDTDSRSTSNKHKPNAAMSAFDELAEQDLQASNEEWEDFADVTTAPVAASATTVPVAVPVVSMENDNPFDQFVNCPVYSSPPPAAEANVKAPVAAAVTAGSEDDDGDFGGFETAPSLCPPSQPSFPADSVGAVSAPPVPSDVDNAQDGDDDDFGDFAAHQEVVDMASSPPAAATDDMCPQNDHNDDDFGDFSSSSPAPVQDVSITFDAKFEDTTTADANGSDDDDFGDFAGGGASASDDISIGRVETFPVTDTQEQDYDDEFNDFNSAPTTTASVSGAGTGTAVDILGDAFAELGDLMDAPTLEGLSVTVQPTNKTVARQLSAEDLLDTVMLDSSLYATPTPVAAPDPMPASPSHFSPPPQSTSGNFLDVFTTPAPIPRSVPYSSAPPPASSSSFLLDLDSFSGHAQLPDVVDRSLTLDELETLFSVLMDQNYFPEAYGVAKQAEAVKKIRELGTKKMQAVENDDLELAIQLRDEINRVKECEIVASREDERYWLEIAHAGKKKAGIEEALDLVSSIDPDCSNTACAKYVTSAPSTDSPCSDRALFYANASRSLQLAIAVRTSHTEHVGHWSSIMTAVSRVVLDALGSVEEYKGLSEADQEAVKSTEPMNVFVRGVLRVVDVGKWVAASCQEAMVETAAAARTLSLCDSVVDTLSSCNLLDLESHYRVSSAQDLSNSSSRLVALMGRRESHCCGLTLRPVSSQSPNVTTEWSEYGSGGNAMVTYLGRPYMQAAISLWTHHFPNTQPPSNSLAYQ